MLQTFHRLGVRIMHPRFLRFCLGLALVLTLHRNARADISFTFTGSPGRGYSPDGETVCSGAECGSARALLTLQDYTPGTDFTTTNLVSFSYSSDRFDVSFGPGPDTSAFGNIGPEPGVYSVSIRRVDHQEESRFLFETSIEGDWCGECYSDTGPAHVWSLAATADPTDTDVPEPAAAAVIAPALLALGL